MVRTQVYLTEEEKKSLQSAALAQGVSQSDLIRRAIDDLLAKTGELDKTEIIEEIAGIWADRTDTPDLRELRIGWQGRPQR